MLQFEVVAYRLKHEYNVDAAFDNTTIQTARWVHCEDEKKLSEFRDQLHRITSYNVCYTKLLRDACCADDGIPKTCEAKRNIFR